MSLVLMYLNMTVQYIKKTELLMIFIIIVIIWMLGSSLFSRMFGSVWRSKQHRSDKTLQGSGILAFRGVKLKIFRKLRE